MIELAPELAAEYSLAVAKANTRPTTWDDFIGNRRAVGIIREAVEAARTMNKHVDHILLFAGAGAGKTSLSRLIAKDLQSKSFETTASTLQAPLNVIRWIIKMNEARELTGKPSVLF